MSDQKGSDCSDSDLQFALEVKDKLSDLDSQMESCEQRIEKMQEELKAERQRREELVQAVRKAIRSLREPLPPLYAASLAGEKMGSPVEEGQPCDQALLSEVFAGNAKAIGACYAADLQTLGQLQGFLDSGKTLRDIEGIGAHRAKEMEEAIAGYKQRLEAASEGV